MVSTELLLPHIPKKEPEDSGEGQSLVVQDLLCKSRTNPVYAAHTLLLHLSTLL